MICDNLTKKSAIQTQEKIDGRKTSSFWRKKLLSGIRQIIAFPPEFHGKIEVFEEFPKILL